MWSHVYHQKGFVAVHAFGRIVFMYVDKESDKQLQWKEGVCITASGNILASGNISLKLLMAPLETIELFVQINIFLITFNGSLNTLTQRFPLARMFPLAVMHTPFWSFNY